MNVNGVTLWTLLASVTFFLGGIENLCSALILGPGLPRGQV